jgi:hypothetical protein
MISLFASIIFVVLLLLIKQSMDKLHAIIAVIAFFIFVQFIILRQLIPLWQQLAQIFTQVPYSKGLLFTAFLLILCELICALLDQMEYESFVTAVQLSVRIVLVSYWLTLLEPAFRTLVNMLGRF